MHRRPLTSVGTLAQSMLSMAFDTLVNPTVALVKVILLGHLVCATMRHIVIVTNALLLFVST